MKTLSSLSSFAVLLTVVACSGSDPGTPGEKSGGTTTAPLPNEPARGSAPACLTLTPGTYRSVTTRTAGDPNLCDGDKDETVVIDGSDEEPGWSCEPIQVTDACSEGRICSKSVDGVVVTVRRVRDGSSAPIRSTANVRVTDASGGVVSDCTYETTYEEVQ